MTLTGHQLYLPTAASGLGSTSRADQPIPLRRVGFLEIHHVERNQATLKWLLLVGGIPGGGEGKAFL
jgi:hypothetical protein